MHHWWEEYGPELSAVAAWQAEWATIPTHASLAVDPEVAHEALGSLAERLQDNYPFHHPCYAGQMLKPAHPVAQAAYAMAMQINPNNHALDGGPATAALEREVVALLAGMFGFDEHLGHLTSSGTIANLEALYIARCLHPGKAIAYSTQAHYTHPRMLEVLGVRGVPIAVDDRGRLDLADLADKLATESIGTVVATLGTTGLGALDPVDQLVEMGRAHGFRVHVDAAYGGFHRLLADDEEPPIDAAAFLATSEVDSIVVDPHKHGLQPYGCGCVIFKDPTVGTFYQHDSPYTYFTSKELHLGEISLECSRAGASAAALWTTLRCLPLSSELGIGAALQATRRAALAWARKLEASPYAHLLFPPQLDILCWIPLGRGWRASTISEETERVFTALMNHPTEPVYLAKVTLPRALVERRNPRIEWDQDTVVALRSVLMKPEHEQLVSYLHGRFEHEAWWPEASEPQPPLKGRALTGPLGLRSDWQNLLKRHFEKIREGLVAALRGALAARYHPSVERLFLEVRPPYGMGGELGVYLVTQNAAGEVVRHVGGPETGFSGTRALLPHASAVVPREAYMDERFAPLWNVEEDAQALAGKFLIDFVAECWEQAGGKVASMPTRLGFEGEEEALDLVSGEWVEVAGRA